MTRDLKDPWEVVITLNRPDDSGGEERFYSYLEHRGRSVWSERTAKRYAREFTAAHGHPATASPA
jgi:hypothetical protein